jgi:hypothetical protein
MRLSFEMVTASVFIPVLLKPLSHPAIQQKYTTDGNKIIGNNVTKLD